MLNLWLWPAILTLLTLLTHHRQTLTFLEVHHRTRTRGPRVQHLSISNIQLIHSSCPNLKVLVFDLHRRSDSLPKDLDHFRPLPEAVSNMSLYTLRIHIDIGLERLGYPEWHLLIPPFGFSKEAKLQFLPPVHTQVWMAGRSEPYTPESPETEIRPFIEGIWRAVFGRKDLLESKELMAQFEEGNY
ncbi:uncharacterized protein BDR25DRAFT_9389 [Lindgomyces ingoldianus]|uniref:Uncharacterized protein n=1 Tax=Lindgomyces ingoldianus TaxID=673940 RepID=A0ACB6RID0_9PLEO|nr:uncharacterized protein BDR25DRAFT_9389 [Lindgomyces ingoldianus]KAF2478272.1 hypothetical protein BDR25DRAFT_9389 [Lindgomyces ingoldianus]